MRDGVAMSLSILRSLGAESKINTERTVDTFPWSSYIGMVGLGQTQLQNS